jgi:hypothetical protein
MNHLYYQNILDVIEDKKQNITDKQYKTICSITSSEACPAVRLEAVVAQHRDRCVPILGRCPSARRETIILKELCIRDSTC